MESKGKVVVRSTPPDVRASSKFVGLENQGATCYLNSLLQALYLTPELREGLYCLDPNEHLFLQGIEEFEKQQAAEKAGGQFANESFLEQLKEFGLNEHGARRSLIAVKNINVEVAMDFYWANSEKTGFLDPPLQPVKQKASKKPRLIPLELQHLFAQLQYLQQRAVSTEALTTKGFQWQGFDGRNQHDAHELNRLLIDALEKSLKNTPGEKLCSKLYMGTLANRIKCMHCHNISERVENFYDLNVQVLDCDDLTKALRRYCAAEVLQGDSAYHCDKCDAKRTALRATVLRELPPVLTFSCNRFKCDKSTNWARVKITDKSAFPLILDMGHFVEGSKCSDDVEGDPQSEQERLYLSEIRSSMAWIRDVQGAAVDIAAKLIQKYGADVRLEDINNEEILSLMTFSAPSSSLIQPESSQLPPPPTGSLPSPPIAVNERAYRGLQGCDPNPLIPVLPGRDSDEFFSSEHRYELFAVINHRGTAHSGHYFAYIRDCQREGFWSVDADSAATTSSASQGILSSDPSVCGFARITKDKYIADGEQPLGLILAAIQSTGRAEQGNRKSLRVDEISKYLMVHAGAANPNTQLLTGKKSSSEIIDCVKTHPEFLEIHGQNVHTNQVVVEVLQSSEFLSRCTELASKAKVVPLSEPISDSAVPKTQQTAGSVTFDTASDQSFGEDAGGWESASTTKKKKNKKIAVSPSRNEAAPNPPPVNAELTSPVTDLAHKIAGRYFGNFFEFDDSKVTAMPLSNLQKAFEGRDSAYLLVYRRIESSASASNSKGALAPPGYWKTKIDARNDKLEQDRKTYEDNKNLVNISVFVPSHMEVNGPLLMPMQLCTAPENMQHKVVLAIDGRLTVKEIEKEIINVCLKDDKFMGLGFDKPVLSNLESYGKGYFCLEPLNPDSVLSEVVSKECTLLIWNGFAINGQPVTIGNANDCGLLQLSVSLLLPSEKGVQANVLKNDMWVPSTRPVVELCQELMSLAQMDPSSTSIHVVEPTGSFDGKSTVKRIFHCGVMVAGGGDFIAADLRGTSLLLEERKHSSGAHTESAETDNMNQVENSMLAERYIARHNLMWTISVEVDCDGGDLPPIPQGMQHLAMRESSSDELPFSKNVETNYPVFAVEVECTEAVANLKSKILGMLQWNSEEWTAKTCLAAGDFPARWALNEIKSLEESSVKNGSTIYLTLHSAALEKPNASSKIAVTVHLVKGNDKSFAFNVKQPGTLSTQVKLEISPAESVTDLRDRAGVELLQLPAGWTKNGRQEASTYRLREVNVQHENKQLLMESSIKNSVTTSGPKASSKAHMNAITQSLKKNKIGNGAILHLEEGPPLFEGMGKYHILLWSPQIAPAATADEGLPFHGLPTLQDVPNGSTLPGLAEQCQPERDALDIAYDHNRRHFVPITQIEWHDDASLQEIQHNVHRIMCSEETQEKVRQHLPDGILGWSIPQSPDHFLLRDCRIDLLPGACFWMHEPSANNSLNAIATIGQAGTGKKGVVDGKSKTLKSLKLSVHANGSKFLVVEMLPKKQGEYRQSLGPTGSFRVWAQRHLSPSYEQGTSQLQSYPPSQICVSGGTMPSMNHLRRPLCSEFDLKDQETCRVFRWNLPKMEWYELSSSLKPAYKKKENITEAPYSLADGDLVCVFSASIFPPLGNDKAKGNIIVSRPEDLCLLRRSERARELRKASAGKQSNGAGAKKGNNTVKGNREATLNIGGDLEFDDDDDDVDQEEEDPVEEEAML